MVICVYMPPLGKFRMFLLINDLEMYITPGIYGNPSPLPVAAEKGLEFNTDNGK